VVVKYHIHIHLPQISDQAESVIKTSSQNCSRNDTFLLAR